MCFPQDTDQRRSQNAQSPQGLFNEGQYPFLLMEEGNVRADSGRGRSWSVIVALHLAAAGQLELDEAELFEPKRNPEGEESAARRPQSQMIHVHM